MINYINGVYIHESQRCHRDPGLANLKDDFTDTERSPDVACLADLFRTELCNLKGAIYIRRPHAMGEKLPMMAGV